MVRLISNAKQWHRFWSIRLAAMVARVIKQEALKDDS